ncbi:polysaccharide deacetylase family protein [Dokdonella sp.]|uniref:polysaccharide deacetylase family protein n=1 Tax=Dokdonella sp. TaxID=2291710 RepID=UPI0031CBAC4D|nr:polysaccharide deacetylase family protein [Dokdonella sp.]
MPPVLPPPRRTILMYHAVRAPGVSVAGEDPHYTVERDAFLAQLDLAQAGGRGVGCARDLLAGADGQSVALTFDDGHLSNYTVAWPELLARGLRADFFINPASVGRRDFASWAQLREMAQSGMSIQSHGYEHRYFDDLDSIALDVQLARSRGEIEEHIGQPVTLLAPPGGRAPPGLLPRARDLGYRHVLGSRPGHLRADAGSRILPRVAVTADLDEARLAAWLDGSRLVDLRAQLRHDLLGAAKHVLGNRRYERLRGRLLGPAQG